MKVASLTTLTAVALLAACDEPGTILAPNRSSPRPSSSAGAAADETPTVVFSNFGPGKSYNLSIPAGWGINGFINAQTGQSAISQRFTPSSNGRFVSAEVAVVVLFGPPSMRAVLQADANGLPGQVMEDIPLQGIQSFPTVVTAASTLRPSLRIGTPYWLTVVAGAAGVVGGWNVNSIGDVATGNFAVTQAGTPLGPWSTVFGLTRTAFQINAIPPTAQDVIGFVVDAVSRLVADGTLNEGEGNAFIAKLNAAIASLDRGNVHAACGQLGAVVNQMNALIETGRLTFLEALPLHDLTLATSSRLGCD